MSKVQEQVNALAAVVTDLAAVVRNLHNGNGNAASAAVPVATPAIAGQSGNGRKVKQTLTAKARGQNAMTRQRFADNAEPLTVTITDSAGNVVGTSVAVFRDWTGDDGEVKSLGFSANGGQGIATIDGQAVPFSIKCDLFATGSKKWN
jgi:hypothetical protein